MLSDLANLRCCMDIINLFDILRTRVPITYTSIPDTTPKHVVGLCFWILHNIERMCVYLLKSNPLMSVARSLYFRQWQRSLHLTLVNRLATTSDRSSNREHCINMYRNNCRQDCFIQKEARVCVSNTFVLEDSMFKSVFVLLWKMSKWRRKQMC